jgi:cation transport regulator ChaB
MSYRRIEDLPAKEVAGLDAHQKETFRRAYNHAYASGAGTLSAATLAKTAALKVAPTRKR